MSRDDIFKDIDDSWDDTRINEESILKKEARSDKVMFGGSAQDVMKQFLLDRLILSEHDNANAVYHWGQQVGSGEKYELKNEEWLRLKEKFKDIPGPKNSEVVIYNNFEATEILRGIALDGNDSTAFGSLEEIRTQLLLAHSTFPGKATSPHGLHCRESEAAKAKCVQDGHHIGWWHSAQAMGFVSEGYRDHQDLKIQHKCKQSVLRREIDGTPVYRCSKCNHNEVVDQVVEQREANVDTRPAIEERRHSRHHANLCTTHRNVVRIAVGEEPTKPGFTHHKAHYIVPELYPGPVSENITVVSFVPETWVRYTVDSQIAPYKGLEADHVEPAQGYADIQWRETGQATDPSESFETIPERRDPSNWYHRMRKDGLLIKVAKVKPADPTMIRDTGRLPEPPPEQRMSVPKPMFFMDRITTKYANMDGFTKPKEYLYDKKLRGWANNGRVLEDWLVKLVRDKSRDIVKDMSDWGNSFGEFDEIILPPSDYHTQVGRYLDLIGPNSKNRDIDELPEPIQFKAKERVADGRIVSQKLSINKVKPIGDVPFRIYTCNHCRKDTHHMKDVWSAGKFRYGNKALFNPSFYGDSGHWKCMDCGSVLMRKALKIEVQTRISAMPTVRASMYGTGLKVFGKADAAIWNVTGYIYGDGYFKTWMDWHSWAGTEIHRKLELARLVELHLKADPLLAAKFSLRDHGSGGMIDF